MALLDAENEVSWFDPSVPAEEAFVFCVLQKHPCRVVNCEYTVKNENVKWQTCVVCVVSFVVSNKTR